MANSTSWLALQSILAPTSSTAVTPRRVGQPATIAGRSDPPSIRRISFEMAIRAPVLPPEIAACASPARSASTAFQRLVPLPRRSAWAGFSSPEMTVPVCRMSDRPCSRGNRASSARIRSPSP